MSGHPEAGGHDRWQSRSPPSRPTVFPAGWKLWQYVATFGIAGLLLLLVPCVFFLREFEIVKSTSAEWQRHYAEQRRELAILKQEQRELEAK